MFYAYILKSKSDGTLYKCQTENLESRMNQRQTEFYGNRQKKWL